MIQLGALPPVVHRGGVSREFDGLYGDRFHIHLFVGAKGFDCQAYVAKDRQVNHQVKEQNFILGQLKEFIVRVNTRYNDE